MRDKIIKAIFSWSGASTLFGVIGTLSAFVTMFVDTDAYISVTWIIATLWLSISIVIILLKVIFDHTLEKKASPFHEIPFQYLEERQILIIKPNEHFTHQIIVCCYTNTNNVEVLVSLGYVHHIQEHSIQIKIVPIDSEFSGAFVFNSDTDLKNILIKPGLLQSTLSEYIRNSSNE